MFAAIANAFYFAKLLSEFEKAIRDSEFEKAIRELNESVEKNDTEIYHGYQ